jgi:hypothetical protein
VAEIVSALATGNGTALTNALNSFVSTKALGDYAKLMLGIPKTLISDAIKKIVGMVGGGGAGAKGISAPGAVSGNLAQWMAQAVRLTGVGCSWIPDLETSLGTSRETPERRQQLGQQRESRHALFGAYAGDHADVRCLPPVGYVG